MSTVAATSTSNSTYSMWSRVPREDGSGVNLSSAFKLTERRVPQDTGQSATLPMSHIFQGAVQFDQDQRDRQLTAALNKKLNEQQTLLGTTNQGANAATLGSGVSKSALALTDNTTTSLATTANRRTRFTLGSNRAEAQTATASYSTQGYSPYGGSGAKATTSTSGRLGAVVDITA